MRSILPGLALALGVLTACGDDPLGPAGSIHVRVTTLGVDHDFAYRVMVYEESHPVVDGTATVTRILPGTREVTLLNVAPNCGTAGGDTHSVEVTAGSTTEVEFVVTCHAITGAIAVTVATTGTDLDPDGYTIQIGTTSITIPVNGTRVVENLSAGAQTTRLVGAAANCTVAGDNPRSLQVLIGGVVRDTARTTFAISCRVPVGTVRIITQTSGNSVDADGYVLTMDGTPLPGNLAATTVRNIPDLVPGVHAFRLDDIAANCTLSGANPRTVTAVANSIVDVIFAVTCVQTPGTVRVVVQTSGSDIDPDGYGVAFEGGQLFSVPSNGSGSAPVSSQTHVVSLTGMSLNCAVIGVHPREVTVLPAATTEVVFTVICTAATHVSVTAQTSGVDPDQGGYRITLEGSGLRTSQDVPSGGTITLEALPRGTYTATLSDLASNCEVVGPESQTVVATAATAQVNFSVTCTALATIAYARNVANATNIWTSKADGSGSRQITTTNFDRDPVWSSTGRIAFTSARNGNNEIYVMDADGSNATRLTANASADYSPSWSPDGRRIAFVSERDGNPEIYVMDADGQNLARVTIASGSDVDPSWSPDGTRIAYVNANCDVFGCNGNIQLINPNGQGGVRITHTGVDGQPAWSPDGTKLAITRMLPCGYYYVCVREILTINTAGTVLKVIYSDGTVDASEPAWSPNGSWLLMAIAECSYYGCSPRSIAAIRSDGAQLTPVIQGIVASPTWKP